MPTLDSELLSPDPLDDGGPAAAAPDAPPADDERLGDATQAGEEELVDAREAPADAEAAGDPPEAAQGADEQSMGGSPDGVSPDAVDPVLPAGDADGDSGPGGDAAPADGGDDPEGLVAVDPEGAADAHESPDGDGVDDAGGPAEGPRADIAADADAGPSPRRRRRAERLLARISALGVKLDDARAHLQGPGARKAARALGRLQLRCVRLAERVQESGGMGKDRGRLARAALSRISSAIDTFVARPSTRARARALREAAREARKALPKRG